MANGGTVFPPPGQSIPGVLDTTPSESKLWPALCCQKDGAECIGNVNGGISLGCLGLQFILELLTRLVQQHSVVVSLPSGHDSLLSTSTLHQTFTLAIEGY